MSTKAESTGTSSPRRGGIMRATGLCGLALLALTACDGAGGDQQQDTAEETVDSDGAEDQGGAADGSETDADDDAEVGEAPPIDQISEEIWSNMEDAETMTLEATVPYEDGEVEGNVEAEDTETLTERYSGRLDGSAVTLHRQVSGTEEQYISFGEETYLRGEHEFDALVEQYPGELDEGELAEEFEGSWVEYSELFPDGLRIQDQLDEFRTSFEDDGGFGELEGTTEQRDGEEVWVYTDQNREFVVRPGDEPVFLSVYADDDGDVVEATFSDWNEAEEPERPAEEDILTMEDLEALLN